jgi:hypothetical protein
MIAVRYPYMNTTFVKDREVMAWLKEYNIDYPSTGLGGGWLYFSCEEDVTAFKLKHGL